MTDSGGSDPRETRPDHAPRAHSRFWPLRDERFAALRGFVKKSDRFFANDEIDGKMINLIMSSSPGGQLRRLNDSA